VNREWSRCDAGLTERSTRPARGRLRIDIDMGRGFGVYLPDAPRRYAAGPLCTAVSSTHHLQRRSMSSDMRPLLVKDGTGPEMASQFCLRFQHPRKSQGSFYMPQSCDMGQTALLPLQRKVCCGFFHPKNPTASAGFEPMILGTRG
jgi:hypothetical protein